MRLVIQVSSETKHVVLLVNQLFSVIQRTEHYAISVNNAQWLAPNQRTNSLSLLSLSLYSR